MSTKFQARGTYLEGGGSYAPNPRRNKLWFVATLKFNLSWRLASMVAISLGCSIPYGFRVSDRSVGVLHVPSSRVDMNRVRIQIPKIQLFKIPKTKGLFVILGIV